MQSTDRDVAPLQFGRGAWRQSRQERYFSAFILLPHIVPQIHALAQEGLLLVIITYFPRSGVLTWSPEDLIRLLVRIECCQLLAC